MTFSSVSFVGTLRHHHNCQLAYLIKSRVMNHNQFPINRVEAALSQRAVIIDSWSSPALFNSITAKKKKKRNNGGVAKKIISWSNSGSSGRSSIISNSLITHSSSEERERLQQESLEKVKNKKGEGHNMFSTHTEIAVIHCSISSTSQNCTWAKK